ncbi:MAG: hypothetical protein ACPH3N_00845 [Alcanivorax sediminis]|uniref:hypothetical protein n=1 Tax=Alcanivorax sediminis TaxID=2663008 RepID=UPI003C399B87
MAGDWIKMRSNLWDDPRIARLCDTTDQPEAMVIGGLYWLWSAADQHTEDGLMVGLSLRQIDRKTGIKGFGDALVAVAWIAEEEGGIRIVNFDEHNGASAKRRVMEAKRKASVRKVSASDADNKQTASGSDAELEKEKDLEKEKRKDIPPKSPKGGRKKPATPIPDDFTPNESCKAKALELGVSLNTELPKFIDHALANDRRQVDWQAAFRTWLGNSRGFARHPLPSGERPVMRKELTLD